MNVVTHINMNQLLHTGLNIHYFILVYLSILSKTRVVQMAGPADVLPYILNG